MTEISHVATGISKGPSPRPSWEDPHPGQRFAIPVEPTIGLCNVSSFSGAQGGVAAKAESIHHYNRHGAARRNVRRHRNTMPKPVKIPSNVPEENEIKSAPFVSSQQISFASPIQSPHRLVLFPYSPGTLQDIDTDTETEVGTSPDEVDEPKTDEASPRFLSDYSNFLGISVLGEPQDDDASVTVVDSEAFNKANNSEDLYGWEAELERKLQCGTGAPQVFGCHYGDQYDYQRADGTKRSFLHRVFSMGNTANGGRN